MIFELLVSMAIIMIAVGITTHSEMLLALMAFVLIIAVAIEIIKDDNDED